jgi:tetratricopeptide (TPR) repeat protein
VTPYSSYGAGRQRRSHSTIFVPLFLAVVALVILVATLPLGGFSFPGARRIQSLTADLPLPWRPARPLFVPTPEAATPADDQVVTSAPPVATADSPGPAAPDRTAAQVAAPSPVANPVATAVPAPVAPAPPAPPAALAAGPSVSIAPPPAVFRLEGFRHQFQTWNNCGPATITMAASHFGRTETQVQAAQFLKPNANDKNVSPGELVDYARSLGLQADVRVAGDLNRLKSLLANGVPVIAETWFTPHPNDGMGHYRLLVGFDDGAQKLIAYDSYQAPGVNVSLPYGAFDADWRVFNRTYIPVYSPDLAPVVAAILGDESGEQAMWEHSLGVALQEIAARPNDAFSWFNAGSSYAALGQMEAAANAFDRARTLKLPWRMLWYQFGPFEAYLAVGRPNDVIALAGANLQQTGDLEESHYYRGRALQAQGQLPAARSAFQTATRLNSRFTPAYHALSTIGG